MQLLQHNYDRPLAHLFHLDMQAEGVNNRRMFIPSSIGLLIQIQENYQTLPKAACGLTHLRPRSARFNLRHIMAVEQQVCLPPVTAACHRRAIAMSDQSLPGQTIHVHRNDLLKTLLGLHHSPRKAMDPTTLSET